MRVVSLLPAATDMVAALGLLHTLVGRTHECDWPAEVTSIPVVTASEIDQNSLSSKEISAAVGGAHRGSSLYTLDMQRLSELRPDVLLTQDLCEVCAVSYELVCDSVRVMAGHRAGESTGAPTVISVEPRTLSEIFQCLQRVGVELGAQDAAAEAVRVLRDRLARVRAEVRAKTNGHRLTVAAIEWLDPIWPAGHWVPEQITAAGGTPLLASAGEHTTAIEWQRVLDAAPEVMLLLPCGFQPERTIDELHLLTERPGWADLPAVRAGEVWVLDGPAYFNRPGPRVVRGIEVLAHVLHGVDVEPAVVDTEARRLSLAECSPREK